MAQISQDLASNQVFTIGPVSGTRQAIPAPLPDSVVFVPSGPVTLLAIDPVTVDVAATGEGTYSVIVSCGSLEPTTISGTISAAVADTLVVPVGNLRNQ